MFTEIGMPANEENMNILKNIHDAVVEAAWETLRKKGSTLFADTWTIQEEDYWSHDQYLERCMWHSAWVIPTPHKNEKWTGYWSRLNAWAWRFIYANCVDIAILLGDVDEEDEEVFEDFFKSIILIGASNPLGGPYIKDMVYSVPVYQS